mmetsp:Transcript_27842/g.92559  ORF Transcript_27842/g.92559 Transcript_27842/m.92559 type:complete len:250 (+) Transcript_27842:1815-2564(+)
MRYRGRGNFQLGVAAGDPEQPPADELAPDVTPHDDLLPVPTQAHQGLGQPPSREQVTYQRRRRGQGEGHSSCLCACREACRISGHGQAARGQTAEQQRGRGHRAQGLHRQRASAAALSARAGLRGGQGEAGAVGQEEETDEVGRPAPDQHLQRPSGPSAHGQGRPEKGAHKLRGSRACKECSGCWQDRQGQGRLLRQGIHHQSRGHECLPKSHSRRHKLGSSKCGCGTPVLTPGCTTQRNRAQQGCHSA